MCSHQPRDRVASGNRPESRGHPPPGPSLLGQLLDGACWGGGRRRIKHRPFARDLVRHRQPGGGPRPRELRSPPGNARRRLAARLDVAAGPDHIGEPTEMVKRTFPRTFSGTETAETLSQQACYADMEPDFRPDTKKAPPKRGLIRSVEGSGLWSLVSPVLFRRSRCRTGLVDQISTGPFVAPTLRVRRPAPLASEGSAGTGVLGRIVPQKRSDPRLARNHGGTMAG